MTVAASTTTGTFTTVDFATLSAAVLITLFISVPPSALDAPVEAELARRGLTKPEPTVAQMAASFVSGVPIKGKVPQVIDPAKLDAETLDMLHQFLFDGFGNTPEEYLCHLLDVDRTGTSLPEAETLEGNTPGLTLEDDLDGIENV